MWLSSRKRATSCPATPTASTDIFVRDRATGITERVSVASDGTQANDDSGNAAISADGRYVAFTSSAHQPRAGGCQRLRRTSSSATGRRHHRAGERGQRGRGQRRQLAATAISADGRYVVFSSDGHQSGPGRHKRPVGHLSCATARWAPPAGERERLGGAEGTTRRATAPPSAPTAATWPSTPMPTNLVPGDTNGACDIFVRDRQAGTTERVSVATTGPRRTTRATIPPSAPTAATWPSIAAPPTSCRGTRTA